MGIVTSREYGQVLSTSMADRSADIEDLVSKANPLFAALKGKNCFKSFSGPEVRQTLQVDKQKGQWAGGYTILANPPIELFNDAVYAPKTCFVPVSLTGSEIRANQTPAQVHDLVENVMDAAETALVEVMDEGLHSDGTGDGGKQISGLGIAVPIVADSGIYGGIDRAAHEQWRTGSYDANSDFAGIGTQVDAATIRPMLSKIFHQRSRATRYADLLIMSEEHYEAYDAATANIQRLTRDGELGRLGFATLEYVGAGRRAEIVAGTGMGSSMPSNTTYGIECRSMRLRYRDSLNFAKLFDGDGQMPINQDALAQFVGWEGELTQTNPAFNWRLYDSNPGA